MQKPVLTIFYQFNPWHSTIGGIQTLIRNFIKYAPDEFEVRLVGTGVDDVPLKWQKAELSGREINFLPLINLQNDNIRGLIPTTVKYTAALMKCNFASDFMHFHRLEPTFASRSWQGEKTLFVHNDIQTQVLGKSDGDKHSLPSGKPYRGAEHRATIGWRRFPSAYFAMEKHLLPQFQQILSCNSDAVKFYQQRYPDLTERIGYVRNTFDDGVFYTLSREERNAQRCELAKQLKLPETTRFILFAGRLHPQKDPLLLVRSFAALNEPDIHLLIVGDGELATDIKTEISRLGQTQQITMLGSLPMGEVAKLHRLSDACVLTSKYEGLPLVVLEALASGTPVVTTNCGETPKFLTTENGIVCSQNTPETIASALTEILKYPEKYPATACVQTASSYAASRVVIDIYGQMFERWKLRHHLSTEVSR
ncbi:glycosyltransferase family 4 protein [Calothrix sp. PCC 6303]|uniref:glycosyltransferase family 4 protein n=1 Tax=Calothrix sp. PCC 6303 TaxID=1170562 RepID=UPI00059FD54F|nr:glycosyltransferase family 4 protein [Calothrix sp. PCC 6303]